jgi:predicted MFS family arabinose efflux permease
MNQDHEAASGRHATLVAVSYSVLAVLPLFLASAQAVQLQRDLDFGKDGLGLAVSVCFAVSAVAATPLGNVVGRIGARAGLKLSSAFSLVSLLLLAALADRWWHLAFALALCGVANATAQVATNVMLAGNVRAGRQGVAFGAKQAAIPLASLAAGLALPVVGLLAGWRVTFAAAAVIVLASLAYRPQISGEPGETRARERGRTRPTPLLLTIALVGLLAGAVANALPTFAVDSAVASGFGEGAAGLLLALGSTAAVVVRVGAGWVADRRSSPGFSELLMLTGFGAFALVLLAVAGDNHVLYVIAMVAVFASGWGWPGLIHFATVRTHLAAPAAASGFVLSAVYVGNVVGPAIVGFIAEHRSYADAWGYGAVVLALATAAGVAARRLERVRRTSTAAG